MSVRIKIGDCFCIPLPEKRYGYCQYLEFNEELGCLVKVFSKVTSKRLASVEELRDVGALFPPVFVGLRASVRTGRWTFIGGLPVKDFTFPKFRSTYGTKPGIYDDWWIWDGTQREFVGRLPPGLRPLEVKLVWGDELLEERIASGENPFAARQ